MDSNGKEHANSGLAAVDQPLRALSRLEEMAKADSALQEMTDAVASLSNPDSFIPAALRIVAKVFQAKNCAYYQHRRGELIKLRYWLLNGRVLSPEDIADLAEEKFAFMRRLCVDGFTVPDSYLGVPFRLRTRASVVDHTLPDPPSAFDDYCNARGWSLELNVPLVVNGEADGAFIIYRPTGSSFTASDIALVERLAQQFALAIELSRLSVVASNSAVAEERERAAQQRANELLRYSNSLKQSVDSLVSQEDMRGIIGHFLTIASAQMNAPIVEYWTEGPNETAVLALTCRDGINYPGSDDPEDVRVRGIPVIPTWEHVDESTALEEFRIVDMMTDQVFREHLEPIGMPIDEWCRLRGVQKFIFIPLLRSKKRFGAFTAYFPKDRVLDQPFVDFAISFGQHLSLAVLMAGLAQESEDHAISLEREAGAQDRASELSRANRVLQETLEQLSLEHDLHGFPVTILRKSMDQINARDGVIFVFDKHTNSFRISRYLHSVDSPPAATGEFGPSFSRDAAPIWAIAMFNRPPVVIDVETDGHLLWQGAVEWNRGRNNPSVVIAPIFAHHDLYGFFAFGMKGNADSISPVDLGVLQALAQQATLAIQMTHLADESQKAALAQERAAEFANANEVLRSTIDQLSKENDLNSFPRAILKEAMNQTGGKHGLIRKYEAQTDSFTRIEFVTRDDPEETPDDRFSQPFPASATSVWLTLVNSRSPVVFDFELDGPRMPSFIIDWHRKQGNRSVVAAGMFIDSKPYGYFAIALSEPASDVSKVKIGLIHALAQQATLAIQLTRLADASEQAAVLVERQQVVVQERANLAREIHDRLAQGYAAILIQQHSMRRLVLAADHSEASPSPLVEHLDIIERLSRKNLAEARKTMADLTIDPFGPGDLAYALTNCIGQIPKEKGFEVLTLFGDELPAVRKYVESELCRIVVEAVTNARKHSRANAVEITSRRQDNGFAISIEDGGIGFDVDRIGVSFGISSMRERAARADAELHIFSAPGRGTQIKVVLKS